MSSKKPLDRIPVELLRRMPKAELHCHLDGCIRIDTIIELAKEQNVTLPANSKEELSKLVMVADSCQSLSEYLRAFAITLSVLQKPYAITRAMYELAEDAYNDGIRYIEVRFSPVLHVEEGLGLSGVMEAVCEGKVLAESRFGIVVMIIVCGLRHLPSSVNENLAQIAWRFRHRGVVGFDLAGPETGFSSKFHKGAFDIARRHNLNCTLHSGEEKAAGWESVWDSIRYCGARRIGHGVALRTNERLLQFVVDQAIAVEVCITSNVQTKAIDAFTEHPLRQFFDSGIRAVPCTDNRVISNVTLTSEYNLIQEKLNFQPWEILKLLDNGFSSAFLGHSHRQRLRADSFHTSLRILVEAGYDVEPIIVKFQDSLSLGDLHAAITPQARYWKGIKCPEITYDLVRRLPKTDLHCRLDGSLSPEFAWSRIEKLAPERRTKLLEGTEVKSLDSFKEFLWSKTLDTTLKRKVIRSLLQTAEDIDLGVKDILEQCDQDGIIYMELMVRPQTHGTDLEPGQVVEATLSAVKRHLKSCTVLQNCGVVVYCSYPEDDPVAFLENAKLAVAHRDNGVCGFGVYGQDIPEHDFRYFSAAFDYLKINHMNVACNAGTEQSTQVTAALQYGAVRLGRCFTAESKPGILEFLTCHRVPVELGTTHLLETHLAKVTTFAGHPLRLFVDQKMVMAICTFERSFSRHSLSRSIERIALECHFSSMDLVEALSHGFDKNFQSYQQRQVYRRQFFAQSREVFQGFNLLKKVLYEPDQFHTGQNFHSS
eukprot:comp22270_c0_seq1/m.53073 comp22270_c0_seq1/g.53073  ORF comp22270_c0_seq1/g.53073 comp22270_c0_seq1/m.53073 type:complete len:766 (-) comp22270_c0_seq1:96-2393(-)